MFPIVFAEPLDPPVRCRVLLSSRLDLRLLGHTMLISVGSLDTAWDEATVATILGHGLAEMATKPVPITAKAAFVKRPALQLLAALETRPSNEEAVDKAALALLSKSLYRSKLEQAGLFLEGVNDVSPRLSALVPRTFVDHIGDTAGVLRQSEWMRRRPVYDPLRLGTSALFRWDPAWRSIARPIRSTYCALRSCQCSGSRLEWYHRIRTPQATLKWMFRPSHALRRTRVDHFHGV